MPIEHPEVLPSTAKVLYAHACTCAYEGCSQPLYKEDKKSGVWTLNSRICHINARRENGPRWNAAQSGEENRSPENLVLMCLEHASVIDEPKNVASYSETLLKKWKKAQIDEHRQKMMGWPLTQKMAEQALSVSFSHVGVAIHNSEIHLGGQGGQAPGAGGGGGGAISPNARAGDGGGGGEIVSGILTLEPGDTIQVDIGQGGKGASLPGQHASDGEDTVLRVLSSDGLLKQVVRAKGGAGAKSGKLDPHMTAITQADLDNGFSISSLFLANAVDIRDGVLSVLGAGWCNYNTALLPCDVIWNVVCTATWKKHMPSKSIGLQLCVLDPEGKETSRLALELPPPTLANSNWHWVSPIGTTLDSAGIWTVRIQSGEFLLSQIEVNVLCE